MQNNFGRKDMEEKRYTLYNSTIEDYDALRKEYESYCEDNEITPVDYGEMELFHHQLENDYEDMEWILNKADKNYSYYLCVGSVGRWNGSYEAGVVTKDLWKLIQKLGDNMDGFKVELVDGHLEVAAMHHDGTNLFSIFALNDEKGCKIVMDAIDNGEYLVANKDLNDRLNNEDYFQPIELDI